MPTWVAANLLDADTRYACQSDKTFGWKDDASFSNPQLWISGNQYIVEPAAQEIPQKGFGGDLKNVPGHCQNKPPCPDIFWTLAVQPCLL